jgi:hypothetical protein
MAEKLGSSESRQLYKPSERHKGHLEDFELTFNLVAPNNQETKQVITSYYTARDYEVKRKQANRFGSFFIAEKKDGDKKLLINVTITDMQRMVSVIDLGKI